MMGWAMRDSATDNQLQQIAEGVKMALVKAAEQGWRLITIGVPNKKLLQQIKGAEVLDSRIATIVEDIKELSSLFFKCGFCLEIVNRTDLSAQLSAQVLSNYQDVEWVNPNLPC